MTFLPNITPADPRDPENIAYHQRPLRYGLLGRLFMAMEVARERRELARLDATLLRDIGLTREGAMREASRGFWDVGGARAQRLEAEAKTLFQRCGRL